MLFCKHIFCFIVQKKITLSLPNKFSLKLFKDYRRWTIHMALSLFFSLLYFHTFPDLEAVWKWKHNFHLPRVYVCIIALTMDVNTSMFSISHHLLLFSSIYFSRCIIHNKKMKATKKWRKVILLNNSKWLIFVWKLEDLKQVVRHR